MREYFEIVLL